jgi:hypothetical protein
VLHDSGGQEIYSGSQLIRWVGKVAEGPVGLQFVILKSHLRVGSYGVASSSQHLLPLTNNRRSFSPFVYGIFI